MFSPKHIKNLEEASLPKIISNFERGHNIFDTQEENEECAKQFGAKQVSKYETNSNGFKMCSTASKKVHSLAEIMKLTTTENEGSNMDKKLSDIKVGEFAYRRYVCYDDIDDIQSEKFVTIWVKRIKAEVSVKPEN